MIVAQLQITSLDTLLRYADKNSVVYKTSYQQSLLAKYTKIAALGNTINFRNPITFSATDNVLLPVSFIPAEAFGGPSGTFRQITLGQQYVSNFNFNPQIDIINPYNWAKLKSAGINEELTELNNQLTKKNLYESIAAAYYNCLSLKQQIALSERSLLTTDSLVFIVKNKYEAGIAREQDLNNATINNINLKDKLNQLKGNLNQQLNSLKILCDIPSATNITIEETLLSPSNADSKPSSSLQLKYSVTQSAYAKSELRATRMSMLPVVSLVYYQGWQQNSNMQFFDNNAKWIQSKYFGVRITMPFPPEVSKLSQSYTNKVNYRIATLNSEHSKLQSEMANESLWIDYEKTKSAYETAQQVNEMKKQNFKSSLNQYKEGILPTDNLLNAFVDMINSDINLVSSRNNMEYTKSKITINNLFK